MPAIKTPLKRREETNDSCALPLVQRLAALLDQDPARYQAGVALPQGWHMILFTATVEQSGLGPDGHPAEAGLLAPPSDLPRRMLGGRRTRFLSDLLIGGDVRRVSEVAAFEEKQGRSGRLAIATVRHSIFAGDATAASVIEEQDVIYRAAVAEAPEATKPTPQVPLEPAPNPAAPILTRDFAPDPVMLFRYSAVTFNAHRIHYDQAYATGTEGYSGLIVNGGLTALLLLELVKEAAGRPLTRLSVRNRKPLICGRRARLCVAQAGEGWDLWAEDGEGRMALEAHAA